MDFSAGTCGPVEETISLILRENEFWRKHAGVGLKGELIAAHITGGRMTGYRTGYDLEVRNGLKIEVKSSKLHIPSRKTTTPRWSWCRPLGWKNQTKDFDFLLLIGEKNYGADNRYLDDSGLVFFLIHRAFVPQVMVGGGECGGCINLTADFSRIRSPRSLLLLDCMVSREDIEALCK